MRYVSTVLCVVLALVSAGEALASRCQGVAEASIVWCDDFDQYCVGATEVWVGYPPFPSTKCAEDGTAVPDNEAFDANWPGYCSQAMGVYDGWNGTKFTRIWDSPFGLMYYGFGAAAQLHVWNFTEAVGAKDPTKNAVNGSDVASLFLKFWTYTANGVEDNSPMYVELNLDGDHAPTDYVMRACPPEVTLNGPYPIVCQQNRAEARAKANECVAGTDCLATPDIDTICPPLEVALPGETYVHKAFAYGALSFMDAEPCNLETGMRPTMYHAVVYDGVVWREIRDSRFPPGVGDFGIASGGNFFTMEIKASSVTVTLENYATGATCPPSFPCWATITRQYTGAFNTISIGTDLGCELDPTSGDCLNADSCADYPTYTDGWGGIIIDTPVLWGGELTSLLGACCLLADLSCVDNQTLVDCQGLDGLYQGPGTECATTTCCYEPFADGDGDGDVDQVDFGLWQVCYDGGAGLISGCECYDRVSPVGVDGSDFTAFSNCFSGANVPADPNCD